MTCAKNKEILGESKKNLKQMQDKITDRKHV